MTKPRKTHELIGTIKYCFLGQVKSKQWKNQPFYYLEIEQQTLLSGTTKSVIYVYPNLVSQTIWKTLENDTFKEKKYLFLCEKRTRGWRLKDWQEIT